MKKKLIIIEGVVLLLLITIMYFVMSDRRSNEELEAAVAIENEERVEKWDEYGVPMLIVSNAKARPGDKVEVSVKIVNNPGILGMSMALSYDENVLKLEKAEKGEAFGEALNMTVSEELNNGCVFLWDGVTISPEQTKDGEILNLKFKVLKSSGAGQTPVILINDEESAFDNNLNPVNLNVENGVITILE